MNELIIKNLYKKYKSFELKDVSFAVKPGKIVGFIGRNGAGKTTTLKCIYNLVKPTSGSIIYDRNDIFSNEYKFKSDIGLLFGEVDYYPYKKIKTVTNVTKLFYPNWNDEIYKGYLKKFGIDENKEIKELSTGMRVKYGLAIALSHDAKILILDEPTSGLDPVSRDELLDIFVDLVSDNKHSILFSTHVISDLEKCADEIVYIKNGQIIVNQNVVDFESDYLFYSGTSEEFKEYKIKFIFYRDRLNKFEGVIKKSDALEITNFTECRNASMEEIMIALERGEEK